jgi:hypothetical protein
LNFSRSVSHFIDWLIDYDLCVWLSHNFVYLVPFCTD